MSDKKGDQPSIQTSPEGLFRYLAVSQVLVRTAAGESVSCAVATVARSPLRTLEGRLRAVSERTLYRWLALYQEGGHQALQPHRRTPPSASRVLEPRLVDYAAEQKQKDPHVSIPEIIARAYELGVVNTAQHVDRTTLYRALQRMGVEVAVRRVAKSKRAAARPFAYPHRMQLLLCDGKHFRAGPTRAKRVALFFLDDATRRGLDVIVGTAESSELFLRGLHNVVRRFGLFGMAFLDQGAGFTARDTVDVVRNLGALLIHGTVAYPQGRGKVERFNRTATQQLLRGLDRAADVDPDCGSLTLRVSHWLHQRYNHTPHESLDGETPLARFEGDTAPLHFPENHADLERRFVVYLERRVSADNVVSIDSVAYEMPPGHAGARVVIHRRVLTGALLVLHEERLVELHPVDLAANARARRGGTAKPEEPVEHPLPATAADLAYRRDYGPLVGPDGGFELPHSPNHEDES